ncbi:RagB/SusD family nutrient uptake outer membrane protein [Paraflavisolibacter sp. H34]|uniref:RagB/SusD family nutrient uptake outer membrane protein n=1 Tax=Huijunlia imazamoxiresistens TaxID=3127457 RepID=UPI003017D3CF
MQLKYFFYSLFTATVLASCVKLTEKPDAFVSADDYYNTKTDALAAVNSIYYALNSPNGTQVPYNVLFVTGMEFMTDDIKMGPGATNPDVKAQSTLDHSASTLRVKEIWQKHFIAISRANIAIDKIPKIKAQTTADAELLSRLVLEARFLRGLFYFNLVRLFGDVPLVLHETTSLDKEQLNLRRTSADSIYAQVIQDFTEAEKLPWRYLPTEADAGRATGAAAKALLSLVYLTRSDWQKAIDKSNEIINRPDRYYDLFTNYADVFNKAAKNGKEHIFSAQFKSNANGHGNNFALRCAPLGIKGINGNLADEPTVDLINAFRDSDKRKAVTLASSYTIGTTTYKVDPAQNDGLSYVVNKYFDPELPGNLNESGINVPIIRYAEVLLINAEANNELHGPNSDAYQNYNLIRSRAGLPTFTGLTANLTKDQFRDSLYRDRRLELTFEYHRWFDLIREIDKDGNRIMVKTLRAIGKPSASNKHLLYPVPQVERDINPLLTQNPGW